MKNIAAFHQELSLAPWALLHHRPLLVGPLDLLTLLLTAAVTPLLVALLVAPLLPAPPLAPRWPVPRCRRHQLKQPLQQLPLQRRLQGL
jgi:hypothetical protein